MAEERTNWISIADIEQAFATLIKPYIPSVHINNAPIAVPVPTDTFAVISVGRSIDNRGAYKSGYGYIYINVRNKKSGVQDSIGIDGLVNDVLNLFPIKTELFSAISPSASFGTKNGDFTMNTIRFELRINQ